MFLRTLKCLGKLSLQQVSTRANHYTHMFQNSQLASKQTYKRLNTVPSFFTTISGNKQSVANDNSTETKFKRIKTASDVQEFAGNVVAYKSNYHYFSNEDRALTSPFEVSEEIRFAILDYKPSPWQGGESGYNMDCFMKPNSFNHNHALINSKIKQDSALSMRPATLQELEFLKLSLTRNQAECIFQESVIQMLNKKIEQASMDSTEQVFKNRRC